MDEMQKIQYAANSYYNRGLEMAKERNLSGAARFLKRALQFNKYHTDARNLLGLIFYEMGETSDALIQWVISINLQPDGNRADYYLDEVQRKPGQLEIASQMVKKFNQHYSMPRMTAMIWRSCSLRGSSTRSRIS